MTTETFGDRIARVRHRFASTLEGKIEHAYAAVAKMSDQAAGAAVVVEETYRSIHGMVGIGPSVGFPATGQAARLVEDILRPRLQTSQGLTAEEMLALKKSLHALREAATRELQGFYSTVG